MFYFQYVIESIRIDYSEFSPEISIRFGELTNKLQLPDLQSGCNEIGLGKQLTLNISKDQLQVWFKQYAFCIELKGGVLNGRSMIGICSLEKLDYTDQVNGYQIVLKDLSNKQNTAELTFSLKFRHIHHKVETVHRPQTHIETKVKERNTNTNVNVRKMSETLRTQQKKPQSFLYGNSSNSKITQKNKSHAVSSKKPKEKEFKKTAQFPKNKPVKQQKQKSSEFSNQNQSYNFVPYYAKQSITQTPITGLFAQQYFCPPPMEFTNDSVFEPQPQSSANSFYPHAHAHAQTPAPKQLPKQKQQKKQQMQNYSFQGTLKAQNKKIQKSKVRQAIQRKKIKQLVRQEFANKQSYVVVPVKAQNGQIIFKKLDDIKQSDLQNLITNKKPIEKPILAPIIPTISKTNSFILKPDVSQNVSVEYPEDFESMSLGNQSMLNREFGTLSKIRKTQEVAVPEESISEIEYSDNFQSYSASRSNIKKSYDDISQSLRSISMSFKNQTNRKLYK